MENVSIEYLLKKINELEKKIEKYYKILKIDNELSFILKGTYVLKDELNSVLNGNY